MKTEKSREEIDMFCDRLIEQVESLSTCEAVQDFTGLEEDLIGITNVAITAIKAMPLKFHTEPGAILAGALFDIISTAIVITFADPKKLVALSEYVHTVLQEEVVGALDLNDTINGKGKELIAELENRRCL